jgi:hypothetical protein
MDDDEDEEDEEEEYLDDEASDDNADADGMEPFAFDAAPAGGSRWTTMHLQDGLLDDLPPPLRVDFARQFGPGGRRLGAGRTGATQAATAGVWDDAGDGLDTLPEYMSGGCRVVVVFGFLGGRG